MLINVRNSNYKLQPIENKIIWDKYAIKNSIHKFIIDNENVGPGIAPNDSVRIYALYRLTINNVREFFSFRIPFF